MVLWRHSPLLSRTINCKCDKWTGTFLSFSRVVRLLYMDLLTFLSYHKKQNLNFAFTALSNSVFGLWKMNNNFSDLYQIVFLTDLFKCHCVKNGKSVVFTKKFKDNLPICLTKATVFSPFENKLRTKLAEMKEWWEQSAKNNACWEQSELRTKLN